MSVNDNKTALVLEAQAKASVPIIESCAAMGLRIIAASNKRHCCGLYSRHVNQRLLYPSPETEPDNCIEFLINFVRTHSVDLLFPVGDVMTDLIAKNQQALMEHTRFMLPAYDIFVQGRNKILTLKAAQRAGCPIPKTWYPKEQPIEDIADQTDFPVLIKPAISAGARGIQFCYNRDQLLEKLPETEDQYGDCFVQELIPQTGTQYKADVILDSRQNVLAAVAYAKLRYYPPTGGSSVLNKTEYRKDVLDGAVKVLKELGWVGFCDFDFIADPKDNVAKLIEINPRYPESYRATVAAGIDMTKIMYKLVTGQNPAPQIEYQQGKYLRFLCGDIMWFLTTKDNRLKAKPAFFNFFNHDTFYQLVRLTDPGIIVGYLLENLLLMRDKKARQARLRLKKEKTREQT